MDRGLDAYFSPPEAVASLLHIEGQYIPKCIWEPAAGDGAIVRPLLSAGFTVIASDIADYGLEGCKFGLNYLIAIATKPCAFLYSFGCFLRLKAAAPPFDTKSG